MTDEINNVQESTDEEITFGAEDYIRNLTALKENTVSKEEYNKVLSENKRLANALTTGYSMAVPDNKEPVDIDALRKDLFGAKQKKQSDLEFFTKAEKLSDAIIDAGGIDPYLPYSKDYIPTGDDIDRANRVHSVIKECIEKAEGDPQAFTNELQRRCNVTRKKR